VDARRAESFSDGVFAVAITILIFNLLPIGREALDYRVLAGAWPQYAAYVVSFMTIGIMWTNHHTLFGHIRLVDRPLLVLNLLLLMGIVALPFPTALIAEHLTGPNQSGGQAAAVVYGAVMIMIAFFYNAIWWYLRLHARALAAVSSLPLLGGRPPGFGAGPVLSKIPRWGIGVFGYAVGTLVAAFVSAGAALAVYALLAIFYLFNHLPNSPGGEPVPDG